MTGLLLTALLLKRCKLPTTYRQFPWRTVFFFARMAVSFVPCRYISVLKAARYLLMHIVGSARREFIQVCTRKSRNSPHRASEGLVPHQLRSSNSTPCMDFRRENRLFQPCPPNVQDSRHLSVVPHPST
jgi:hypothetical protein